MVYKVENHMYSLLSKINFEHYMLYDDRAGAGRLIVGIRMVLLE